MAEHKLGTMDITAQEKTFHGFIKFVIRTLYVIFAILVILMIFGA
ncbi:aa3-type cytochrome c oxidase subunit IV [Salipiger bermudensis]|nr:aa3-type cytochrome c oxidase subunit IV [Salipiger bermudensis]MCA0962558.1 aa3-type cytochrome c oxidase subunit IV [Salipiger bermudensis]